MRTNLAKHNDIVIIISLLIIAIRAYCGFAKVET